MADAGNSFQRARIISPTAGLQTIRESLNARDRDDYFRFRLTSASSFDAFVSGIRAGNNFDLILYNQGGRVFRTSAKPRNANEAINLSLNAGTWYLRVRRNAGSTSSPYTLRFSANPDRAGSTFATARNLGNLPNSSSNAYLDYVGTSDRLDFYRFAVTTRTTLTAALSPFAATANVQLFDASFRSLGATTGGGTALRRLQRVVNPGTYYARILAGGPTVRYSLRLTNAPVADGAGNNFSSARLLPIGFTQSTFSDFVGAGDTTDFFRFNATTGGDLLLRLSGTTANLDINLYNSQRVFLNSSTLAGGVETLSIASLPSGSYFFEVKPANASQFSTYTLTSLLAPPDNVGDTATVSGSTRVTTPGTSPFPVLGPTSQSYQDFASGADQDVFRFEFTNSYNFLSMRLQGLTANLDMEFFKAGSTNRIFSSVGGTGQEAFEGTVGAGTYYLRIFSPVATTGSSYNLVMSASSDVNRPSITRDVSPGGDSNAQLLTEMRELSTLFFVASDGAGFGLWKTKGSLDTTIKVATFTDIDDLQAVGNTLYIAGSRAATGQELYRWVDNGTDTGVVSLVADLTPGTGDGFIDQLTSVVNPAGTSYLYFLGSADGTAQGRTLYRTSGNTPTAISNPGQSISELTVIGTTLYYRASGAPNGSGGTIADDVLWRINAATGASVSATALTQLSTGGASSTTLNIRGVSTLRAVGNDLYFVASENLPVSGNFNREWRRLSNNNISTLNADNDSNDSSLIGVALENLSLTVVGNYVYFTSAANGEGAELFRSNLTTGAIEAIPQINDAISGDANPTGLTVYNNQLFFSATAADGDVELYVITSPEAAAVAGVGPAATKVDLFASGPSSPGSFRIASDKLYFVATTADGTEVYSYDGSTSATSASSYTLAFDIAPGTASSDPAELVVVGDTAGDGSGGRIYFTADDGTSGREVWVI